MAEEQPFAASALTDSKVSNAELGEWLLSGSWVSSHLTASHPPQGGSLCYL